MQIQWEDMRKCKECGATLCDKCAYQYVDGNNLAITLNGCWYCRDCYSIVFSVPSPVESFKQALVFNVTKIADSADGKKRDLLINIAQYIQDFKG